jgi:serine/threonine-protein kinase
MMSRSGGFNVPADFFKERGMPAPVPATPAIAGSRRRWGVYAGVAGVAAAIAIVVGIFAKSSSSTASSNLMAPAAPPAAPVTPSPVPPAAAPPPATAAPAAPEPKHVLFASEPLDSHVFHDGQDLGASPVTIDVPAGQKVTVEVRREGYKPQLVTLDGSEKKVKTNLVRVPVAPGPKKQGGARPGAESGPAKAPPGQPPPALGGGEIVNPWAK